MSFEFKFKYIAVELFWINREVIPKERGTVENDPQPADFFNSRERKETCGLGAEGMGQNILEYLQY